MSHFWTLRRRLGELLCLAALLLLPTGCPPGSCDDSECNTLTGCGYCENIFFDNVCVDGCREGSTCQPGLAGRPFFCAPDEADPADDDLAGCDAIDCADRIGGACASDSDCDVDQVCSDQATSPANTCVPRFSCEFQRECDACCSDGAISFSQCPEADGVCR